MSLFWHLRPLLPQLRADDAADTNYDPRHVDGSRLGGSLDLSGKWLVKGSDDPSFASSDLDDSSWQTIPQRAKLADYGIHDQPIVWYRLHVQVPASETELALLIFGFQGSMEMYVNGTRVGNQGDMRDGGENRMNNFDYPMQIPSSALNRGNLVIAMRGAVGKGTHGEHYESSYGYLYLGRSKLIQEHVQFNILRDYTSNGLHLVLQIVSLLVLAAFLLALPAQPEYKLLIVSFGLSCAQNLITISDPAYFHLLNSYFFPNQLVYLSFQLGSILALIEFVRIVLGQSGRQWIRVTQASITLATVAQCILNYIQWVQGHDLSDATFVVHEAVQAGLWLPFIVIPPVLLCRSWLKERRVDSGLLLPPVLLWSGFHAYYEFGALLYLLHLVSTWPKLDVTVINLTMGWYEIIDAGVEVTLLVYVILRVVRTLREGARYASEVEAAQTVQKVLLARSQQATPGFKVDTVYLPSSEVGGDFFLVSPGIDGSLVAIVGDVAGKGMLAAMRVSVILGILRREDSREPGTILTRLNDSMILQGDMGLTTACCVRMEQDGTFAIANAGHISPYIAGREVPTVGALPLGIVSEQNYEEQTGRLEKDDTFVLMSDGVVEARSTTSELYGFERLAALTRSSAAEIANTAKAFGQEDDITVMTLTCLA